MSDLNDVVILVDDYIAQKIVAIWPKTREYKTISDITGLSIESVTDKIEVLIALNIIDLEGNVSEYADKLVKARASKIIKATK